MSIEAMKHYEAALLKAFPKGASGDVFEHWNKARQAIAEAEQDEPVAWFWFDERDGGEWIHIADNQTNANKFGDVKIIPLYAHPQPKAEKQEPVGWIDSKGNMLCVKINESCKPLYTHPQPRKPQTDREIGSVIDDVKEKSLYASHHFGFWIEFCRAIEKAHGIKE